MGPAEEELKRFLYTEEAKKTYNPSSGASLETHINNHLQRLNRDKHYGFSTIKQSETVGLSINKIKKAKEEFYMAHGRYPTPEEISRITNIKPHIVEKHMRSYEIKAVPTDDFSTGTSYVDMHNLLPTLSGTEKKVADAMMSNKPISEAIRSTGLRKTTYYKHANKLKERMREAYLRSNTFGE